MAKRKKMLSIDFSCFAEYAERLEDIGADVKDVFDKAMENAGSTVQKDTEKAMSNAYLPAHGKYSKGDTVKTIVVNPRVRWSGNIGEIGLGFDRNKPGAGSWLITGTPRMKPDYELAKIYSRRTYETKIKKQIKKDIDDYIEKKMR